CHAGCHQTTTNGIDSTLSTTDVDAARTYYTGLFGWECRVTPTPMGVDYNNALDGQQVVGMGLPPPDMAAAGVLSMWNAYVIVEDADAAVAAAVAAGGRWRCRRWT
ncbi:MAG: hypothetical protein MZU95_09295, partial [Desulfomicrobium escambiense]|nr:hypothetical protein [Desulfomicrobium escambiense]